MSTNTRLTKQQVDILILIYRFRFISSKHVRTYLGHKNIQQAQRMLNLLVKRQDIGKNYSASDRLNGRHAAYYLQPKGIHTLKTHRPAVDPKLLHNIFNDKVASLQFQEHCLDIGDVNYYFNRLYGDNLEFFTRSELVPYSYFPKARLDAYMIIQGNARPKSKSSQYFLVVCKDRVPFFTLQRTIRSLVEYAGNNTWRKATGDPLPTTLLVCDSLSIKRYMLDYATKAMSRAYIKDIHFFATTKELLAEATPQSTIWESAPTPDD